MPCKNLLHSFFYLADYGVQEPALGTYIDNLPNMAGFLCMYLAYLINLRGEKKREKRRKEQEEEKRREKEKKRKEDGLSHTIDFWPARARHYPGVRAIRLET